MTKNQYIRGAIPFLGTVCKGTDKNVVACLNLEFLNYFVQIIETYAVKQIMFF